MVLTKIRITNSYWESLEISKKDIEFIYSTLLEEETPLPSKKIG